ncbi:MAG: ACT domain-containing protein [Oscillospiraceae bacterium]|nr:ACT domain-containing protein [Oscillospiraceae bacterium]
MKAVISVIGKDAVGILAKVSTICAENNANVTEVTQSVLQDVFAMVMLVDITNLSTPLAQLSDKMTALGKELGLSIYVMHEDIFNTMHHI